MIPVPARAGANYFHYRAVIDLKIQERRTGNIIGFDHQESTAIDAARSGADKSSQVNAVDDAGRTAAAAAGKITIQTNKFMKKFFKFTLMVALVLSAGKQLPPMKFIPSPSLILNRKDEMARDLGPQIATLVNANLSAEPNLITVERAELDKALGEQELGLSGTVTPDSAAKVGHLTGAKVLVTGRVFKTDTELFIVAKIIGTETSRVYGELVKGGVDAPISDLSANWRRKSRPT